MPEPPKRDFLPNGALGSLYMTVTPRFKAVFRVDTKFENVKLAE